MPNPSLATCDECGSAFRRERSGMAGLCPECAHLIYGYEACRHAFEDGRCRHCGWDGSRSAYTASISVEASKPTR